LVCVAGTNEFWLSVLTDLKNRGLKDIFVACIDGLTSFPAAITAVSERTKMPFCVVPPVRAAMRYVVDKDCRLVAANLKKIDNATTLTEPVPIRRAISTTNAIESANSAIRPCFSSSRQGTRNRKIYPNEDSALKVACPVQVKIPRI
jgi:transposase-like protein